MNNNVERLIDNNNFTREDAIEVFNIIKTEEGLTNKQAEYYNFSEAYDILGARWSREEIVEYMNMDNEKKLSVYEILRFDYVYQLASGLIITWRY